MNNIQTYVIEKFNVEDLNINVPKFYKVIKNETKLAYLLLSYMYYTKYSKKLNMNSIVKDENNKPIFINKDLYFNISHSKDYVACSLAPFNIGIDIEQDRNIKNNIIERIKHINDKNISLIEIWNIKEAYSKYLGIGLKLNFANNSINYIKQNTNIENVTKIINNNKLYFTLCYDKKFKINSNFLVLNKEVLLHFIS